VLGFWAQDSAAQDRCQSDSSCRKLTQEATQLATQKRCEPAIALYEKAYQQSNEPRLLLNIGRCQHRLGQPQKALALYEEFRRLRPNADAETTSRVGQFVAEAKLAILAAEKDEARTPPPPPVAATPAASPPAREGRLLFGRPLWRVAVGAAGAGVGAVLIGLGAGALAANGRCAMPSSLVPGQCMASYGPDGARVTEVLDGVTPGVPMLLGGLVLFAGGIALSAYPAPRPPTATLAPSRPPAAAPTAAAPWGLR
jgi:hypothetical protein